VKKFIAALAISLSLALGFGGPAMAQIVLVTPGKTVHGPCKAKHGAETARDAAGTHPAVLIEAINC
jgi:hypothetical protein